MSGPGLSGRGGAILSRVYLGAVFLFVFAPILASFVFSFNSDRFPSIPLGSFTFHWYQKAFSDPDVWDAFATSLKVAVSVALLATAIGFCTAYTDFRFGFRFKPTMRRWRSSRSIALTHTSNARRVRPELVSGPPACTIRA